MGVHITEDEVDKRARQMRDEAVQRRRNGDSAQDITSVSGLGQGVHAKWVNKHAKRVNHFKNEGYEVVKVSKDKESKIKAPGAITTADNELMVGDNILMVTSRDNLVERLARKKVKGEQAENAFQERMDGINKLARDAGIRKPIAFDESKQGSERVARRTGPDE